MRKTNEIEDLKLGRLTSSEAARLLMVSRTLLYDLEKDGWIARSAPDEWSVVPLVRGFARYLKDRARRAMQVGTLSALQSAKAKQIEMRTAREAGDMMPVQQSLAFVTEVIGLAKSTFDSVPARCFFHDLTNRAIVRREVDQALNEMAKHYEALGNELLGKAEKV